MSKKVYIIYKPGCSYSERALSILAAYKDAYPEDINIYLLPSRKIESISSFCSACGLCSGESFPQIWIDTYENGVKKGDTKVHKLSGCTGYIGGCNDLIALMNDLGFNWTRLPGTLYIDWKKYWYYYQYAPSYLTFDTVFDNFFLLEPSLYYWG